MSEIAGFLITFRETLEAALIVGIILSYLVRTKQEQYAKVVYVGIGAGVVASIAAAILFTAIAGGFEGATEQLFEGTTMLVGAFLITFMILWLMKQERIAAKLREKVGVEVSEQHRFGLFLLVFVSVLREGIETVLFLGAASFAGEGYSIMGSLAGIIAAVFLGFLLFVEMLKINLKKVFLVTGILLVLFSAGLVAHGVHEFQEAGVLPVFVEHVWDINPPLNPDGSYPLLHEKGDLGGIAKGLFGYNGNPSLVEVISYAGYVAIILALYKRNKTQKETKATGKSNLESA